MYNSHPVAALFPSVLVSATPEAKDYFVASDLHCHSSPQVILQLCANTIKSKLLSTLIPQKCAKIYARNIVYYNYINAQTIIPITYNTVHFTTTDNYFYNQLIYFFFYN